jgi:hypothetical protein
MKSYLLFFFCLLMAFHVQAQNVPNGGFENWTNYSGYSLPDSWNTTDSISSTQQGQRSVLQETTFVHSGSSAMKMQSWTYNTIFNEPAVATNGTLNSAFQFQGGSPDSIRYQMLTGWYIYNPVGGDSCTVSVLCTRWNGTSRDTVAVGVWSTKDTVTTYSQFSVTINYVASGNPDTALIVISSAPIGINTANAGTVLYIDDLNFSGLAGINELPPNLVSINTFPNPASDYLNIDAEWKAPVRATISIIDVNGKLLQSIPMTNSTQRIDVSYLANGNYFYELMDDRGNKLYAAKFSVSHE